MASYNKYSIKTGPNVFQLRLTERFWRNLKKKFYKNGRKAYTYIELKHPKMYADFLSIHIVELIQTWRLYSKTPRFDITKLSR